MSEFRTSVFSEQTQQTYQPEKEVKPVKRFGIDLTPLRTSKWVRISIILLILAFGINVLLVNNPLEAPPREIKVRAP